MNKNNDYPKAESSENQIRDLSAEDLFSKLKIKDLKIRDLKQLGMEVDLFRSSGRGGQNVNKVETGVRLKYAPLGIEVKITEERSQAQNFRIAVEHFREILEDLTRPEKPRVATKPSRSAKKRRMEEKKKTSEKKKFRGRISTHEFK